MAAYVGQIEVIRANQVSYGEASGVSVAACPDVPIICVFAASNIDGGVTVKVLSSSLTLWSCAMMPFTSRQEKQKDSVGFGFSWWRASDSNGFADALNTAAAPISRYGPWLVFPSAVRQKRHVHK